MEEMENIINCGKEYDYGDKFISFCKRSHAFERPADKSQDNQQHNHLGDDAG